MVDVAEVKIWGELVGAVQWNDQQKLASFEFSPDLIKKGWDLSPIKMPVSNGSRIYRFPELRKANDATDDTFKGLPGLLADSLPDKYGNKLINRWLEQNNRLPESMNPVEKLCFIGNRGMGALEFEPAYLSAGKKTFAIELSGLVDIAKKMLSNRKSFQTNLKADEEKAMREILKVGTSAGGARPKALIAFNDETKEIRSGQTKSPKGFEHWLLKLDGVSGSQFGDSHGWGHVEYAYYLMAKACGINMMECRLLPENGRSHFMTRRFDREDNDTKHHVQTLCALQHFDYNDIFGYSYEQVFQTMRALRLKYPDAEQMFRRMVFNVLATNYDDHTKNFGFLLKKDGNWELAPAYDVCFSFDPANAWVSQQTLSINGKRQHITKADLMTIAKNNNIKKGEAIIDEINRTVQAWGDFSSLAKVTKDKHQLVISNLNTL
ncbi:MAG: type II toxin-antitoxin system HipA family toxin [Prolixibacteraceae bacterium]|jgi:serine/threonine-protein kinase HipA|nr:type II toxin-antitoxin system HipA family toxin [Prolixibacteraceae bacterium]